MSRFSYSLHVCVCVGGMESLHVCVLVGSFIWWFQSNNHAFRNNNACLIWPSKKMLWPYGSNMSKRFSWQWFVSLFPVHTIVKDNWIQFNVSARVCVCGGEASWYGQSTTCIYTMMPKIIRACAWENQQFGVPTRSDTNQNAQSHNKARSLKFRI